MSVEDHQRGGAWFPAVPTAARRYSAPTCHPRWEAAKQAGIEAVPVVRVDPEDEIEEKRILLTDNEYRDKTPGEKVGVSGKRHLWTEQTYDYMGSEELRQRVTVYNG